ncbi:hypothetical protein PspLS_00644 [Pyricularia sp. CBS 133598]|nr:hypothetical protein PspLS_00644 [Pyricularia sp. CBS 133598]
MAPHPWLQPTTSSEPSITPPITKQHQSTPNPMSLSSTGPQPRVAAPIDNVGVTEAAVSQPNATEPKQRVKMKRTSGIQASRMGQALKTSAVTSTLGHGMHRPLSDKQPSLVHGISGSTLRQAHLSLTDEDEDEVRPTSASSSNLGKRYRNSGDDPESDIFASSSKKIKGFDTFTCANVIIGSTLPQPLREDKNGRPYNIYQGDFGMRGAWGALIPEGYIVGIKDDTTLWPCPVRGCGVEFTTNTALGNHFEKSHHSTTFSDNRDGTLSEIAAYGCPWEVGAPIVVSQVPRNTNNSTRPNNGDSSNCFYHGGNARCSIKEQLKLEFQQRFPDFDRKLENAQMQRELENDNRVTSPELADPDQPSSASPEAVSTRSRGPPMNYNLKKLSKNSMGADRSKDSRAKSREAPDPLNADDDKEPEASPKLRPARNPDFGITGASGRKVSHVPLPTRLQSKGAGVPNGVASAHSAITTAPAINNPAKVLDDKMETWEVGPGFVRNEESDKIAFSTAYLNGTSSVPIADGVSCRLEFLKAGCSRTFDPEHKLRICWVSSGKVEVELDGKKFNVGGPGGVIKLNKGAKAVVFNSRYIDACLQITEVAVEN